MLFENRFRLPAQYIRKAWFIILEDVRLRPKIYRSALPNILLEDFYTSEDIRDAIEVFDVSAKSFVDESSEKLFFLESRLSPAGKTYKVSFVKGYLIKHRYIQKVCHAIAYAIHRRLQTNAIPVSGRFKSRSLIQNQLHRHLSKVIQDESRTSFEQSVLPIGQDVALAIVDYALLIARERDLPVEDKVLLENFKEDINSLFEQRASLPSKPLKVSKSAERHKKFWVCEEPEILLGSNSFWLQYERIDFPEGSRRYGLSVGAILFEKTEDGYLGCTFVKLNHHEENKHVLVTTTGLANVDNNTWLHVELYGRKVASYPTLSKLTIRLDDVDNQELLIGHYNFFALSRQRYLTKNVIWVKQNANDQRIYNSEGNIDNDYLLEKYVGIFNMQNAAKNPVIPKPIISFLRDRSLNRLTMPRESLMYVEGESSRSLETWLIEQVKGLPYDPFLEASAGRYFIVYYHGDKLNYPKITPEEVASISDKEIISELRFDTLNIIPDELKKSCTGTMKHYVKDIVETYSGELARKETSIEILLTDADKVTHQTGQKNIILLTFSIPPTSSMKKFESEMNESSYFTGLVSGLSDDVFNSVSYKMLLIKRAALVGDNVVLKEGQKFSTDNLDPERRAVLLDFFRKNAGGLSVYGDAYVLKK